MRSVPDVRPPSAEACFLIAQATVRNTCCWMWAANAGRTVSFIACIICTAQCIPLPVAQPRLQDMLLVELADHSARHMQSSSSLHGGGSSEMTLEYKHVGERGPEVAGMLFACFCANDSMPPLCS